MSALSSPRTAEPKPTGTLRLVNAFATKKHAQMLLVSHMSGVATLANASVLTPILTATELVFTTTGTPKHASANQSEEIALSHSPSTTRLQTNASADPRFAVTTRSSTLLSASADASPSSAPLASDGPSTNATASVRNKHAEQESSGMTSAASVFARNLQDFKHAHLTRTGTTIAANASVARPIQIPQ